MTVEDFSFNGIDMREFVSRVLLPQQSCHVENLDASTADAVNVSGRSNNSANRVNVHGEPDGRPDESFDSLHHKAGYRD